LRTRYLFAESLGVFGGSLAFTGLGLLLGLEGTTWTLALLAALPYLTLPLDLLAGLLLDRLDRRTLLLAGVWLRAGILGLFALLPKEPLFLLPLAFLFQAVLALDLPAWHALLVRLAQGRLEREGGVGKKTTGISKRRQYPNLQKVRVRVAGQEITFRVAASHIPKVYELVERAKGLKLEGLSPKEIKKELLKLL